MAFLVFMNTPDERRFFLMGANKKQLSLPRKVSLSRLADGSQQIGESMSYENSFIKLDEKREINYRKYCELMKRNRIKVKIRDV